MKRILLLLALVFSFFLSQAQVGKKQGVYNVKDYGLVDDSTTDNTAKFRALVNLVPDGARIYFPGGGVGYLFTDSILLNKNLVIFGDGYAFYAQQGVNPTPFAGATYLFFRSATKNFLHIDVSATNNAPVIQIEKLSIVNSSTTGYPTAGAGIVLDHQTFNHTFRDMEVRGFYVDIDCLSAIYLTIDNCRIAYPVKYGISLNNYITPDGGGFNIINTKVISGFSTPNAIAGIYFRGGGAVHIINTDINGGSLTVSQNFNYGIYMDDAAGATSDIMISDILVENFQVGAIKINNLSGGRLADIQISKIEFLPFNNTGTVRNGIEVDSCWRVTIDDIVGYNNSNVPYAFVKLVNDTGVVLGARLLWSDANNPTANGWAASDSLVNCFAPVRTISSARTPSFTLASGTRVVVKVPEAGGPGDSTYKTTAASSFFPTFSGYNNTVSFAQGATATLNTITMGAADTVNPGLLDNVGQFIKGAKTFTNDITASGWPIGNGNNCCTAGFRIGSNALNTTYTGTNNIAIGTGTQPLTTSGASNVSIGNSSMATNLTGARNMAIGTSACNQCKGSDGVAIGDQAMVGSAGTTALGATAIGSLALNAITTADYSVGIGYLALTHTTTGIQNVAVGVNALATNITGAKSTAVGDLAAFSETSDGGVFLGNSAGYYETAANKFDIANSQTAHLISGDFSTGQVCINCTTTGSNLVSLTSGATLESRGGPVYSTIAGSTSTIYPSFVALNTGAATSGNQQYGGAFYSQGNIFATSSKESGFRWYNKTANNAGVTSNTLTFETNFNGGAYSLQGSVSDDVSGGHFKGAMGDFQGMTLGYTEVSATANATTYYTNATAGTFTITLPNVTTQFPVNTSYHITNSGSGTVTVGTTSSQNITNGGTTATTVTLAQGKWITVVGNGTKWFVVAYN